MENNLEHISQELKRLISEWEEKLLALSEEQITSKINRQERTIKQILGHMIDSASNNHQRIIRLQYTPNLSFPDYQNENDLWVSIQHYQSMNWEVMVNCWKFVNLHLAHVFSVVDKSWLKNEWSDGIIDPVTLEDTIFNYVAHLKLHLKQIQSLIAD